MIDRQQLLKDLQRLLPKIERDILSYSESKPELHSHLKQEYAKAKEAHRTAEHFVAWREAQITQAAVAWILTCVFVRFLEDNELLDEPMIAGPAGTGLQHAKDRTTVYFSEQPTHAEREYLLNLFEGLEKFPVMAELLDHRHNPLWQLPVSADGARAIIDFFQQLNPETGEIVHDFTDANWDTRFLGDLYQDLSESVRKRYALLQTPEFVESFILDYTLEKAKDTFGLPGLRLIDPTCGSGHFLLTTFERLFNDWIKREPTTNARALAQRALDSVYGVDINPYAIAVARFRLLIAAMKAAGSTKIKDAPDFLFNLAVGDSLLHGRRHESQGQGIQTDALENPIAHVLEAEDLDKLERILGQRYHIVVGNPPYITVKDKALNQAYRDKYLTCYRKYSLGVPFTERFFDLTLPSKDTCPAGYMGMITTNSFMKREFGKKLVEEYLSRKDLTHLIDTSRAHIPGHGTPTVILVARNRLPQSECLRAVLGVRGEPSIPADPANGKVWSSILNLIERPGNEDSFISVLDQDRRIYSKHPWSVSGGGAGDLKQIIESGKIALEEKIALIGFGAILGEDEAFGVPSSRLRAINLPSQSRPLVEGEQVRDWSLGYTTVILFPYDNNIVLKITRDVEEFLWPLRSLLWQRNTFGNQTYKDAGRSYAEYHQIPVDRNKTPLSISFAHVATHNHFVFDRGGKVFNRSAPVIKLPNGSSEADHLHLLGLLNSSTACFWMKQVCHNKGNGGIGGGIGDESWEPRFDFDGTKLKLFPIPYDPVEKVYDLSLCIDQLCLQLVELIPSKVLERTDDMFRSVLKKAQEKSSLILCQIIALQEELDWCNYKLYGLTDENLCYQDPLPRIHLGERAFEISLAIQVESGLIETDWFNRHGSRPITEMPYHWPDDYRALVERRLQVIEENRWIRLVEQPEFKRRWNQESWEKRQQIALQDWLCDFLAQLCQLPQLQTCAQLADRARNEKSFEQVASLYTGTEVFDAQSLVGKLVANDCVPGMSAERYKPRAMPKYKAWLEIWRRQRAEDAIDARTKHKDTDPLFLSEEQASALKSKEIGDIPLSPKYVPTDFKKQIYWTLRGKLDVPKERFFSMPHCEKAGDNTLVIGWAGLNHLQRAQAIAAWYLDRKEQEGWDAEQLKPMLVALDELIPWLKQWHNEVDPEYGERLGDYYEGFLLEELRRLDISRDDLAAWAPPATTRGGGHQQRTN